MNDKEFRDVCAMMAMQEFLKDDLTRREDKQMGHKWIVEQSYKMADMMVAGREK